MEEKEYYAQVDKIIYSDDKKQNILRDCILDSIKHEDCIDRIKSCLSENQYFMKHKCFEYEKERRFLVAIPINSNEKTFEVKFRCAHGNIIPYIEYETEAFEKITGITIGPFADVEFTKKNLEYYITQNDQIVLGIETTDIPIRF